MPRSISLLAPPPGCDLTGAWILTLEHESDTCDPDPVPDPDYTTDLAIVQDSAGNVVMSAIDREGHPLTIEGRLEGLDFIVEPTCAEDHSYHTEVSASEDCNRLTGRDGGCETTQNCSYGSRNGFDLLLETEEPAIRQSEETHAQVWIHRHHSGDVLHGAVGMTHHFRYAVIDGGQRLQVAGITSDIDFPGRTVG